MNVNVSHCAVRHGAGASLRTVDGSDLLSIAEAIEGRHCRFHFELPYQAHDGTMLVAQGKGSTSDDGADGYNQYLTITPVEGKDAFMGRVHHYSGPYRWSTEVDERRQYPSHMDKDAEGEEPTSVAAAGAVLRQAVAWLTKNSQDALEDRLNENVYWAVGYDRMGVYEARVLKGVLRRRRESTPASDVNDFTEELRYETLAAIVRDVVRGPRGQSKSEVSERRAPVRQSDGKWRFKVECEYDYEDFVYETQDQASRLDAMYEVCRAARLPAFRNMRHKYSGFDKFRYGTPCGHHVNLGMVGILIEHYLSHALIHDNGNVGSTEDNYANGFVARTLDHPDHKDRIVFSWWAEHRHGAAYFTGRGVETGLPAAMFEATLWMSLIKNKRLLEDGVRNWLERDDPGHHLAGHGVEN